jgi:hypothetical protein
MVIKTAGPEPRLRQTVLVVAMVFSTMHSLTVVEGFFLLLFICLFVYFSFKLVSLKNVLAKTVKVVILLCVIFGTVCFK